MRGEHVADLGPRGRKESCRTRSLASRACLRLVEPNGRTPAANLFRRVAVVSRAHDPRRVAPRAVRHRPSCTIAAEDQARVIVGILENPSPHGGKAYPLYGPVEFTYQEIANVLSRVLGKEVQYKQVSIETMLQMMTSGGQKPPAGHNARALYGEFERAPDRRAGDSFTIQHLREVAIDHQNGVFAGTNDLVETIGGRPATTLEAFIDKHRAALA